MTPTEVSICFSPYFLYCLPVQQLTPREVASALHESSSPRDEYSSLRQSTPRSARESPRDNSSEFELPMDSPIASPRKTMSESHRESPYEVPSEYARGPEAETSPNIAHIQTPFDQHPRMVVSESPRDYSPSDSPRTPSSVPVTPTAASRESPPTVSPDVSPRQAVRTTPYAAESSYQSSTPRQSTSLHSTPREIFNLVVSSPRDNAFYAAATESPKSQSVSMKFGDDGSDDEMVIPLSRKCLPADLTP